MGSEMCIRDRYKTAIQRQPGINAKSAINQVLNTPEILAMILAEMDMRTLLISAQRVCRTWLNLISESPSIQKALFFTPIKGSEWGMEEKTSNPLLAETFPSFFPAKGRPMYYQFNFSDLAMAKDASTMARFVRDDASWRRMLVQQPPISDIGVLHICHTMSGDYAGSSNIPVSFQSTPLSNLKVSGGSYMMCRLRERRKHPDMMVFGWKDSSSFCSSVARFNFSVTLKHGCIGLLRSPSRLTKATKTSTMSSSG